MHFITYVMQTPPPNHVAVYLLLHLPFDCFAIQTMNLSHLCHFRSIKMTLLLSMKMYLALFCSALLAMESTSDFSTETSKMYSKSESNTTTKHPISAQVLHTEKNMESATWSSTYQTSEVSAIAETTVPTTAGRDKVLTTNTKGRSHGSWTGVLVVNTEAATATAGSNDASKPETSQNTSAQPSTEEFHPQSHTTFINVIQSATTSAASETVTLPQPTSATEPGVPGDLLSSSSNTSPTDSTQTVRVTQSLRRLSSSVNSTVTTNTTSAGTPHSHVTIIERSTTSSELSSPQYRSETPTTITTLGSTDTHGSTLLMPLAKSTTRPPEASKTSTTTEIPPCTTRDLVKVCLIIIACLAGLVTIFLFSTIILCIKVSARKYKVKKARQPTEMMNFSALLPELNYSYTRQHNPVMNGVLVIHSAEDSDEEGGDNLTLRSFLPENDHFV